MKATLHKWIALTMALVLLGAPATPGLRTGSAISLGDALAESVDTTTSGPSSSEDMEQPDESALGQDDVENQPLLEETPDAGSDSPQDAPDVDSPSLTDSDVLNPDGETLPDGDASDEETQPDSDASTDGDNQPGDVEDQPPLEETPDAGPDVPLESPDAETTSQPDGDVPNVNEETQSDGDQLAVDAEATLGPSASIAPEETSELVWKASATEVLIGGVSASEALINLNASVKVLRLTAQVKPSDALQAVVWKTSNKKIATISAKGLNCTVTGLKAGTATITAIAKDGSGKSAQVVVTVAALSKKVTISGSTSLFAGGTTTLKASVSPKNTTNKKVLWSSGDESIATVDINGVVTAKVVTVRGTVTITATAADGSGAFDIHTITVYPQMTGVMINGSASSEALINLNASVKVLRLTAQLLPVDAYQAVVWKTSNKKIATISTKGLNCTVTGIKAGTATITATATDGSGKSAQVVVTVAALSKKVTISGATSLVAGATTTLKAAVSPQNTTNKNVLWTSGNESVATVDARGVVTAKNVTVRGTVTIKATAADGSGASGAHTITVYPRATGVLIGGKVSSEARIDLNAASKSLKLVALVAPSDAVQSVVWTTSNKKVASISTSGLNCTVSGLMAGTAVITATASDGSGKFAQVVVTASALAKKVTVSGASELIAGASTTLNASVSPKGTTNKSVMWTSGDASIATVDNRGVVTAADVPGLRTVAITATAADGGGASGTHAIRVYPVSTSVQIFQNGVVATEGTIYLGVKDKTLFLTAAVTPTDVKPGVTWKIDNGKIAKLSPSSAGCKVTGLKAGLTIIRATAIDGRTSAAFSLTVKNGLPSAAIRSITPEKRMIQRSERASWTVDATGYGNLTFSYEILRNGQPIPGASPDLSDGKVSYYQTYAGGVFSLRVILMDAAGSTAVLAGGDVTVCEMNLSQAPDEIPVSGIQSGYYATFGPDITPPAGVTIQYSLNVRTGPQDALILGYAPNESRRIDYTARSLGHVQAELTYNAFDGEQALFSGAKNIEFDLVKETDLPTAIRVEPAEITGAVGEEVFIPEDHIVLTGGKLIPSNLSYIMRNASGAVVGDRLSATFDAPGRYAITLTGEYFDEKWTCPVTFAIAATDCTLEVYKGFGIAYLDGAPSGNFAHVAVQGANLAEGENASWGLERVNGGTGAPPITLYLTNPEKYGVTINFRDVVSVGTVRYRLTYEAVGGLCTAEREFTVMVEAAAPGNLPTGCSYPTSEIRLAPGETRSFDTSLIVFTGGNEPAGAWRGFGPGGSVWEHANVTPRSDGMDITFRDAGRYVVNANAGVGNISFSWPIVVIVEDTEHPALKLVQEMQCTALYAGGVEEGYLGRVLVENLSLDDGVDIDWSIEPVGEDDQPAEISIDNSDAWSANLSFHLNGGTGSAQYRVALTVGALTASTVVSVNVEEAPSALPTGIESSYDARIQIQPGDSLSFELGNIAFTGGGEPENAWKDIWQGDGEWDGVGWDWSGEVLTVTFPDPGRYFVTLAAGVNNIRFTRDVEIVVSDEADHHLRVDVDPGLIYSVLYTGGEQRALLGYASVPDAVVHVGAGETCDWTLEKTGGEGDPIALTLTKDGVAGAFLNYALSGDPGTAKYQLTYRAAGVYYGVCAFTVTVLDGPPASLPSGIDSPFDALYRVDVGESLSFDPSGIKFETPGEVPDGLPVWKAVWPLSGDWSKINNTWEGEVRHVAFLEEGRFFFRAVIGLGNVYYSKEIEVIASEAAEQPLKVEIGFDPRFQTAYLDGEWEQHLGSAWPEDIITREGEGFQWTLTRLQGEGVAELWVEDERIDKAELFYRLLGGTGTVRYRLAYTAAGGLYAGEREIVLEVAPGRPEGLPSGIATPYESQFKLRPGESLSFDTDEFRFAQPGAIPEGETVLREFWNAGGDWDPVDEEWDDGVVTMTFPDEGSYTAYLAIGVCNFFYLQDISIIVSANEDYHLDVSLGLDRRFRTAYLDGELEQHFGFSWPKDVAILEGEKDFHWTISPLEGGDIAEMSLEEQNPFRADIHYRLLGGMGTVRYKLTYTAADGIFLGEREIVIEVASGRPEGLPSGIVTPYGSQFKLRPGESLSFDVSSFEFKEPGSIPTNEYPLREFWNDGGDWGSVDEEWQGSIVTKTFPNEGLYTAYLTVGVLNFYYRQAIKIVVSEEADYHLDVDLGLNQRFQTAYLDGETDQYLGDAWVENGDLASAMGEDFQWTLTPLEGAEIAELSLYWNNSSAAGFLYKLSGSTGTVRYRLNYQAAKGLIQGEREIVLEVASGQPEGLPSGIVTLYESLFKLRPGESLSFDTGTFQFAQPGSIPEGETVLREVWDAGGDWSAVDQERDDGVVTLTFPSEGLYTAFLMIGVSNFFYLQDITIIVSGQEDYLLDPRLNLSQRYSTLYTGGEQKGSLGYISADNVVVPNGMADDYHWTIEKTGGTGDPIDVWLNEDDGFRGSDIRCSLKGGAGTASYHVTYEAMGVYRGGCDFSVTVVDGAPEGIPSGIDTPFDDRYLLPVDGSISFDTSLIEFANSGNVPEDATVWKDVWGELGDWDQVDFEQDEGILTFTFRRAGRYTLNAVIGVSNILYTQRIEVVVGSGAENRLDAELNVGLHFDTLYPSGVRDSVVGYASVDNVVLLDGEGYEWSVEKIGGDGNPLDVFIGWKSAEGADIRYTLTSGAGNASYRVTYSAANGLYYGEGTFTVTVANDPDEALPSGISTPFKAHYDIGVGEFLSFDRGQIDFATGGTIPQGEKMWRDIWGNEGDWGKVDEDWGGDICAFTFREAGRYTLQAVIGINNAFFIQEIEVVVGEDVPLDPDLTLNLRYTTLYVSGVANEWMGNVSAYGAVLDEGDDYHWSIEKTGSSGDPIDIALDEPNANLAHIAYTLKGGTGSASFRVTYEAADGRYQDDCAFTLTVAEDPAEPFPSGILTPFDDAYVIDAGTKLSFDTSLIGFTSDGVVPEGASVYRNVYDGVGDWSQVDTTVSGGVRESTFHGTGHYTLEVEVGINNVMYRKWIEVTVKNPTFRYSLNPDAKTITITGYAGSASELVVPALIDDFPVTGIGDWAFSGNKVLTRVDLPDSVTRIGANAFRECSLAAIDLPDGLTSLGEYAFSESGLATIDLPDGITSIAFRTFYLCIRLWEVDLPAGLTSIDYGAFAECWSLHTIDLPDGVTSLGGKAFYQCGLTEVHLPDGLDTIGYCTFSYCRGLPSIDLPEGLTSIGYNAFDECNSLAEVDFPESLTRIDPMAFTACSLKAIDLPDGLTSIGEQAFSANPFLTAVDLPDGLTSIGVAAFSGCTSLPAIDLPDGLTSIGNAAFDRCYVLRQVSVGTHLISFSMGVFSESANLESITIHANDVTVTDLDLIDGFPNLTFYVWDGSLAEAFMRDHNLRYDLI